MDDPSRPAHPYDVVVCRNPDCEYHDRERKVYLERLADGMYQRNGQVFCECSGGLPLSRVRTVWR